MTNHTQINKGKTEIQFDNSRVSGGQNNDHDRPARTVTSPVEDRNCSDLHDSGLEGSCTHQHRPRL